MTYSRLAISLALLIIGGGLLFQQSSPGTVAEGASLVGLVAGYWLHVGETAVSKDA